MSDYVPPDGLLVSIKLGEDGYTPADGLQVSINLSADATPAITQYIGGDGTGFESFASGQSVIYLQFRRLDGVGLGDAALFGASKIFLYSRFISPIGIGFSAYGAQKIINKNRYVYINGLDAAVLSRPTIQNFKRFLNSNGLNALSFGRAKIQSLKSYLSTSGRNFLSFGSVRVSHKEQGVIAIGFDALKFGNQLVAFAVRTVEMSSVTADMSRFGKQWIEYNPRYIEPRGIFELLPSNHKVSPKIFIQPEGLNATRFGTRIIPEIQTVYPKGFEGVFGLQEIYNFKQIIKAKGFLSVGEFPEYRWGRADIWNRTQQIKQNHNPDDGLNPPNLNPPNLADRMLVQNRNRLVGMVGVLHQRFGYQNIENGARVLGPMGLSSPIEVNRSNTLVADRIRYFGIQSITAPLMGAWHRIHLAARLIQPLGDLASSFGDASIANTRRNFRFIGLGDQSMYGRAMISDSVRSLGFESRNTIAAPIISLPLVRLGTRYIETFGFLGSRLGWNEAVIRWNKLYPRWELKNSVGEPRIKNVTPELRARGQGLAEYGYAKIELYKRFIKFDGLNAALFGRSAIGDSKQYIVTIGVADPAITKFHDVKRMGGKYIPHLIDLTNHGIFLENFEKHPEKLHRITQNVLRPESEKTMTLFGNTKIAANTIRVEPGYWEILFGRPNITHKNREIKVSEFKDMFDLPKFSVSPHTIYAGIVNPPQQAVRNHVRPSLSLHPIDGLDSRGNRKEPGVEFGIPIISHRTQYLHTKASDLSRLGEPLVKLTLYYIQPKGLHSLRIGVLGPLGDQIISFRNELDASLFGQPTLAHIESFHRNIQIKGSDWLQFGKSDAQLLDRKVYPVGLNAFGVGSKKNNDKPYMWQGLRVGEHIPTQVGNIDFSEFGGCQISLWVRDIQPVGFDSALVNQYDYAEFNKRLRVVMRDSPEQQKPTQHIKPFGLNANMFNASNIQNQVHYIRPDGNAEQFRKGAF